MKAPNAPDGFGTRPGDREHFEDPDDEILVAGDDAELVDAGEGADTDALDRAIDALEHVRWSDVETVSPATAAAFVRQLRHEQARRQESDRP